MLRAREAADDLGPISLNISGCINACGHHHAANIGILGLNKAEKENYQITLGGRSDERASVGEILGPGFAGACKDEGRGRAPLRYGFPSEDDRLDRTRRRPLRARVLGLFVGKPVIPIVVRAFHSPVKQTSLWCRCQ